jgi:hypothetical protein
LTFGFNKLCFSVQECKMNNLDGTNIGWNASPTGCDVWSAKNGLFLDYTDMSVRYDQALQTLAQLKHCHHVCRADGFHHTEHLEASAVDTDNDHSHVSAEAALTVIEDDHVLESGSEDTKNNRCAEKPVKQLRTAKLSSSCSPLNLSVAGYDESANDSLLKTPAGYYDRLLPFSGPSIPPLFERDEASLSDVTRSRCSSPESLSASSCNDDLLNTSSDFCMPKCEGGVTVEDPKMTSSTPCPSPVAVADRSDCIKNTCKPEQLMSDESRLCDRLVCSVISQVISDDVNMDSWLLDCCSDIETSSVEDKSFVGLSDRSNTSSPDGKSTLNPMAPTFRVKTSGLSKSSHISHVASPVAAVRAPVSFSYVPQVASSVAWGFYPAYLASCQTSSSSGSRKAKPALMHYTPLRGKTQ